VLFIKLTKLTYYSSSMGKPSGLPKKLFQLSLANHSVRRNTYEHRVTTEMKTS